MIPTQPLILFVVLAIAFFAYLSFRALRRRKLAEIQRFEESAQTDDDSFVLSVGLSVGTRDAVVALAIRRAIAELGRVPPTAIRAKHKFFPDLEHLPFFDSIDFLGLVLETEAKTNSKIPCARNDTLYDSVVNGTVADYVHAVLQSLQSNQLPPSDCVVRKSK